MDKFSGLRLRAYRERAGKSRMDLARGIDFLVGPQQIGRYEAGDGDLRIGVASKMAEVLEIELEDLLDAES